MTVKRKLKIDDGKIAIIGCDIRVPGAESYMELYIIRALPAQTGGPTRKMPRHIRSGISCRTGSVPRTENTE